MYRCGVYQCIKCIRSVTSVVIIRSGIFVIIVINMIDRQFECVSDEDDIVKLIKSNNEY